MTTIDYDQAAEDYARNRRVHPAVLAGLVASVTGNSARQVLEVGCGTGNYAAALRRETGAPVTGIDPAAGMIHHAQVAGLEVAAGRGEALPCAAGAFDLVFTVDVIHHMVDVAAYFREARRVLRPGGAVCTVTDSDRIIATRQPLAVYWPETVDVELRRYHSLAALRGWMAAAGLATGDECTVEHTYFLVDAQPYRARAYSTLRLIPEEAWRRGLAHMEADLARGPITCVARYVLLWGRNTN